MCLRATDVLSCSLRLKLDAMGLGQSPEAQKLVMPNTFQQSTLRRAHFLAELDEVAALFDMPPSANTGRST